MSLLHPILLLLALARLLADGRIERDERGAYRLGPRAAAVSIPRIAARACGLRTKHACSIRGNEMSST